MNRKILTLTILAAAMLALAFLAGCDQQDEPTEEAAPGLVSPQPEENPDSAGALPSARPQPEEAPSPDGEDSPAEDGESTAAPLPSPLPRPTPLPTSDSEAPMVDPIEVTYFTPAQQEGPYYTVEKPADRDNDLTVLTGAAGAPEGQVLEFAGTLYDAKGLPVPGAVIEIWQTDFNGAYLHPNDPSTANRDQNFQFYGEAVTDEDGGYEFRTIMPGKYEPRPRHIHVKIKLDGAELLTTQFYFSGDPALAEEAYFSVPDGEGLPLIINLDDGQDDEGNNIFVGQRDIVLGMDISGR